jgi:cell division protein FtsW (lipid II flippase)
MVLAVILGAVLIGRRAAATSRPSVVLRIMVTLFAGAVATRDAVVPDSWHDKSNTGYQVTQSLIKPAAWMDRRRARGEPGEVAVPPAKHTDFIFAIVGEDSASSVARLSWVVPRAGVPVRRPARRTGSACSSPGITA